MKGAYRLFLCGPLVGMIGKIFGLRMAFYASAAILSPVLGLYILIQKRYHKNQAGACACAETDEI